MKKSEIRWVISSTHGLYVGARLTRKAAIQEHCMALGQTWDYCRNKGDRAIKCRVTPIAAQKKG